MSLLKGKRSARTVADPRQTKRPVGHQAAFFRVLQNRLPIKGVGFFVEAVGCVNPAVFESRRPAHRPRPPRADEAGGLYHALNRGNLRATIFHKEEDFEVFEQILFEALQLHKVQLFSFQLMPNHYHLVPRPQTSSRVFQPAFFQFCAVHLRMALSSSGEDQPSVIRGQIGMGVAPLSSVVLGASHTSSAATAGCETANIDRNPLFAGVADPILAVP